MRGVHFSTATMVLVEPLVQATPSDLPIPNVMKYIDGTARYTFQLQPKFRRLTERYHMPQYKLCELVSIAYLIHARALTTSREVLGVFDEEVPMASSFIFLTLETALKPYATEQRRYENRNAKQILKGLEDLEDLLEDIDDDDLSDIAKNAHAEDRQASRYPEREEEEEERWLGQQEEEEAKKAGLPRVVWLPDEKGRPRFKPS